MTNTSDRPLWVDGVRLDSLAWNITKVSRAQGGRRSGDQVVPGTDGVLPTLNDDLEPARLGLDMFVMGTDEDGTVPPEGRRDTLRANLDTLVHLFGTRHRLLEVVEQVNGYQYRRAWAKVQDALAPELNLPGSAGTFTVGLVLPYGVWEDQDPSDWAGPPGAASGTPQEVDTLRGATERILDAVLVVQGPATNPRVTDEATGAYVELQAALSAAESWRVNVGTWATRRGAGLGLGSADTAGTDSQDLTRFGGTANQAAFLPLVPARTPVDPARRVTLSLSGTGFTGSTALSVRARRKFAL